MTMNNKNKKNPKTCVPTKINKWGLRVEVRWWRLFGLPCTPATHLSLKIDEMQYIGGKADNSSNTRVIY